jgi:hypothetical protein
MSVRRLRPCLLLAAGMTAGALQAAEPACDRSESIVTPSPDGRFTASVQHEVCATATGAAAGITVVLTSATDATQRRRVFMMPVPRSREEWARVRWQDAQALEIRIPNLSEAAPPEPQFAGIRISLAYCGDNAEDRARLAAHKAAVAQWQKDVSAWVARRKADGDSAGARPARPEEPRLAPGRCID